MKYLLPWKCKTHYDSSSSNNSGWVEYRRPNIDGGIAIGLVYRYIHDEPDGKFTCLHSPFETRISSLDDAKAWVDNLLTKEGYYLIQDGEEERFRKVLGLLL